MTVCFQGVAGAFGEEASIAMFGSDANLMPVQQFDDVFAAVEAGDAAFGVVPIENALAGSILENYDLLLASQLQIVHETSLSVSHNLMVRPGTALSEITHCYSHPQALAQCRNYLKEHAIEGRAAHNTAIAAQLVAENGESGAAAIASSRAAEIYGLTIVARDIQHRADNRTRFIAIAKSAPEHLFPTKASLVFSTANRPGALLECLRVFQDGNFNLTKLESRPTGETLWEYYFYVDLEIDESTQLTDEIVGRLVESLRPTTDFIRLLGTYSRVHLHA